MNKRLTWKQKWDLTFGMVGRMRVNNSDDSEFRRGFRSGLSEVLALMGVIEKDLLPRDDCGEVDGE